MCNFRSGCLLLLYTVLMLCTGFNKQNRKTVLCNIQLFCRTLTECRERNSVAFNIEVRYTCKDLIAYIVTAIYTMLVLTTAHCFQFNNDIYFTDLHGLLHNEETTS